MKKLLVILFIFLQTFEVASQILNLTDSNFVKCIKANFPTVINSKNQLIISEAENAKGTLSCSSSNIHNVEGLQYFIKLSTIKLPKNSISYIPAIPKLVLLQQLDLSDNNLRSLPELSNSRRLKGIHVQSNELGTIPDLSKNDSLEVLNIHSNQLDTLPDLSALVRLKTFSTMYNNLKYLPNVDKLISLENLHSWKNQLLEVPPLIALKKLIYLDLSYNKLTKIPELGTKPNLEVAYFNDNFLTTLPDFSQCPKLENVRLYKNLITFREAQKLKNVLGFDTLFKLSPTEQLKVGRSLMINEFSFLKLSTGIDKGVPGMSYEWYKNGSLIKTSSGDSLKIDRFQLADSGKYMCILKNAAFPTVSYKTDTFDVHSQSCPDPSAIAINTTEMNCFIKGSISINGYSKKALYKLTSVNTTRQITSQSGNFNELSENAYKLTIDVEEGCSYNHPKIVQLDQKECEEVLISPNNDGAADSYYFPETGTVIIYDKRGNVVKTLTIPGSWDGSSDKGKTFNGFFVADINNGTKLIGITVLY